MTRFGRLLCALFLTMTSLVGCTQTMQYTPRTSDKNYHLTGLRLSAVDVQVNDLRPQATASDSLRSVLRSQVIAALAQNPPVQQSPDKYILIIDIIEHRAYFSTPIWNASTRLRIRLADPWGVNIGQWEVSGNKSRFNWGGYATAKELSQEAYDLAVADMMSALSKVDVPIKERKPVSAKVFTIEPDKNKLEPLPPIIKELPKIAVWDLEPMNTPVAHARQLTSFVVSEITKLKKYEVYSQKNVRTLAGWTAERMQLGCTDTKCLTALGQMDIAKLISGSVGKIGNRYTVSMNLFDTQKARAENALSKTCQSEDELIELIQASVRELLGESPATQVPAKAEPP